MCGEAEDVPYRTSDVAHNPATLFQAAHEVLAAAWPNLTFTVDPIASSLTSSAEEATELGLLDETDLTGIYDLTLLNEVLQAAGKPEIPVP